MKVNKPQQARIFWSCFHTEALAGSSTRLQRAGREPGDRAHGRPARLDGRQRPVNPSMWRPTEDRSPTLEPMTPLRRHDPHLRGGRAQPMKSDSRTNPLHVPDTKCSHCEPPRFRQDGAERLQAQPSWRPSWEPPEEVPVPHLSAPLPPCGGTDGDFTPSAPPTPASVPQDSARRRSTALTTAASWASAAATKVSFSSPAVGQERLPLDWLPAEVRKGRPVLPGRSGALCPANGRCPRRPQCAAVADTGVAQTSPRGTARTKAPVWAWGKMLHSKLTDGLKPPLADTSDGLGVVYRPATHRRAATSPGTSVLDVSELLRSPACF